MDSLTVVLQILGAAVAGLVIGLERQISGHPAGMRTHSLIAFGAATFTAVGVNAFGDGDPGRVAAQVVTGIGFVGAGAILRDGLSIRGLTTAASLWATAAVGTAFAAAQYAVGIAGTVVVVGTLAGLGAMKPFLDRFGSAVVVLSVAYEPGHGTLGPLLRTLTTDDSKLLDLVIEDKTEPHPIRIVHIQIRAPKAAVPDIEATAWAIRDERPEIESVEVAGT